MVSREEDFLIDQVDAALRHERHDWIDNEEMNPTCRACGKKWFETFGDGTLCLGVKKRW
jgi:hypothetical protein